MVFAKSLPIAPSTGKGTFAAAPNFGMGMLAQVVFNGGMVGELEAAALAGGGSSVWVQDSTSAFQLLIAGGPMFLKSEFMARFPGGFPGGIGVTLTRPSMGQ